MVRFWACRREIDRAVERIIPNVGKLRFGATMRSPRYKTQRGKTMDAKEMYAALKNLLLSVVSQGAERDRKRVEEIQAISAKAEAADKKLAEAIAEKDKAVSDALLAQAASYSADLNEATTKLVEEFGNPTYTADLVETAIVQAPEFPSVTEVAPEVMTNEPTPEESVTEAIDAAFENTAE